MGKDVAFCHFNMGKSYYPHLSKKQMGSKWEANGKLRNRNYKGKVVKIKCKKCSEVVRTYDKVQLAYALELDTREEVKAFRCNVPISDELTTDFVIELTNGCKIVRECVLRSVLSCTNKFTIAERLDYSRNFWLGQKADDWGLVVDEEK